MKKAIILLSGGLDSATTLAIAKHRGFECYALSVSYGQRAHAELNAARRLAETMGVIEHRIMDMGLGDMKGSALTDHNMPIPTTNTEQTIPNTYVPARNTVFFSIALGWAEVLNAEAVFSGICAVDYSGYPDCRPEYLKQFQTMANLATKCGVENRPIQFYAPLLYLSKAEIIQTGIQLGLDYGLTVSCYQATPEGFACRKCTSCLERQAGFEKAKVADPTAYVD